MKKTIFVLAALVLALSLAACGSSSSSSTPPPSQPVTAPEVHMPATPDTTAPTGETVVPEVDTGKYGGTVRLIDTGDFNIPIGLPWQAIVARNYNCVWAESLHNMKNGGRYEPWLATSWDIDMNKQTITFHLRDDVWFSDGSHFDAEVLKWSFKAWEDDGRGNEDMFYEDVKILDEYTVEITYRNWQNVLIEHFGSKSYAMVSMENYLKNGKEYAQEHPVGSGPFKLKEYNRGSSLIWERRDDYWNEGLPFLDTVEYHCITDVLVQSATLMSNGSDAIDFFQSSNPEQVWGLMEAQVDFDYSIMNSTGSFVLCPNSMDAENNPFYDIRVRTAVSHAIDRQQICDAKGFGIWKPSRQMTGEGFAGYLGEDHPYLEQASYDPELAKQMLADAGYPNGFNTKMTSDPRYQDQIIIIQDMLKQVGVNCEVEFPEPGALTDMQLKGWEGLFGFNWGQVSNTGVSYYIWYHPDVTSYVSAYRPPEYEEMYLASRRSEKIDFDLFANLGEMVLKYQTFIPVYSTYSVYFLRNGLKDDGFLDFRNGFWYPWAAYWDDPVRRGN